MPSINFQPVIAGVSLLQLVTLTIRAQAINAGNFACIIHERYSNALSSGRLADGLFVS